MKRIRTHVVSAVATAAAILVLAGASTAEAQRYGYGRGRDTDNEIRFRGGAFALQGGTGYWDDAFRDFRADKQDFQGGAVGFDYLHEIAPFLDLMIGTSYYYADHDLAYRNFEDERGRSIFHTTRIQTATFDTGLVLRLVPRQAPIVPYIGGGGTAISYRLEEEGDFVDFTPGTVPHIFHDRFRTNDVAYGWFALAGLEIPVSRGFSVFAEGRWQQANATLSGDFDGFGRLNLNGAYAMVGAAWRF